MVNSAKDERKYVLKNIFHTEFEYQLNMQTPLRGCPNLRVVIDTVPEHLLFVYNYCTDDLLKLAEKENLSGATRKKILREALVRLECLHEQKILHGGKQTRSHCWNLTGADSFCLFTRYQA